MSTDSGTPLRVDGIDARRLRPVVKLLLVATGLGVLWWMVTSLPGLDELVPIQPVPASAFLGDVVTLGIVAALAYAAVALLVAYDGFGPILLPTLEAGGLGWLHHLTFLVLALVPTFVIAECIYHDVDEVADILAGRLAVSNDADAS